MRGTKEFSNYNEYIEVKKEVGRRLRLARKMKNISVLEMGAMMNVSYQAVRKYEIGSTDIPISRFVQYCTKIGVSPEQIMTDIVVNHRDAQ